MKESINIEMSTSVRRDSARNLNLMIKSQDIHNSMFLLNFRDGKGDPIELGDGFTVEVLSVFKESKSEALTEATIYGNYAHWEFDTRFIHGKDTVFNYVYVKKDGVPVVSADANAFYFAVDLSKIDEGAERMAEYYDKSYEKVLHDFEVSIDMTKEEWAQMADETRNFVDGIKGVTVDQFVETKMGEELANLEVNYATRLTGLENNDASLTAQLAETKSEAERKRKLEDLDSEVLSAIEGGDGTSFNLLSIPQSRSVTPEKTTFMTNNLEGEFLINRSGIALNGVPEPSITHLSSSRLPVSAGTYFLESSKNYKFYIYGYDENLQHLTGTRLATVGSGVPFTITNPELKSIAITTQNAGGNESMMPFDVSINVKLRNTKKEGLKQEYLGDKIIDSNHLKDKIVSPSATTFMHSNEVLQFNMIKSGISAKGLSEPSNTHISSTKVSITPGTYKIEGDINYTYYIYLYDENGNYIDEREYPNIKNNMFFTVVNPSVKTLAITTQNAVGNESMMPFNPAVKVILRNDVKVRIKEEYLSGITITNEHLTDKIVSPNITNFYETDHVGFFELAQKGIYSVSGVDVASDYHVSAKNLLPIKPNVLYRIETNINYPFRIYGFDKHGDFMPGNFYSGKLPNEPFSFINTSTEFIKITTHGQSDTPVLTQPLSIHAKVRLVEHGKSTGFLTGYEPESTYETSYNISNIFTKNIDFASKDFRIPFGVATKHDTIVAGSDIRMTSSNDFGDNRIGVARSSDLGKTWTHKTEVIKNTFTGEAPRAMDGLALYDEIKDEIYVFGVKLSDSGYWYADGATKTGWDFVYVKSTDDGRTWSSETSLKHLINDFPDRDRFLTGVGTGIQMKNGTLVVPIQYSTAGVINSGIIYSPDGLNWTMSSGKIPESSSECNVAETEDGTLILNARPWGPAIRLTFSTDDMGTTWVPSPSNALNAEGSISQYSNMGSLVRHKATSGKESVLLSTTYSLSDRSNFTLFKTVDGGKTWLPLTTYKYEHFKPGAWYGYTCLITLKGRLYVMMENNGSIDLWDISVHTPLIDFSPEMKPKP